MTWDLVAQLAGAFFLGALWMYRRQRDQIRLLAEFLADLQDDLFTHALHDDPDDDLQDAILDAEFYGRLDATAGQSMPPPFPEMN